MADDPKINVMEAPEIYVERTLAIIKPDAIDKCAEIEDIIIRAGFQIIQRKRCHLTPEQASEFYVEHFGKMFFPSLLAYMSSGPVIVYALAKDKAISHWRELIGPTNTIKAREEAPDSLRAKYGTDDQRNALHGSDGCMAAAREIHFFFPNTIIEPVSTGDEAKDYISKTINPTLLSGLTELCKNKPEDPVTWLADWLLANNPFKPVIENSFCVSEPSM